MRGLISKVPEKTHLENILAALNWWSLFNLCFLILLNDTKLTLSHKFGELFLQEPSPSSILLITEKVKCNSTANPIVRPVPAAKPTSEFVLSRF